MFFVYDKALNEKEFTLEVLIIAVEDNTEFQKTTVSESNISIYLALMILKAQIQLEIQCLKLMEM